MAKFNKMVITRAGLDMIAQSQAGGTLIFTKAKLGDGQIEEQSIPDLTDLVNSKMDAQISTVTAKAEGHVEIKFIVDNQELDVGFFVREVGIFAKVNDEGVEQLYGYANAGNYTNYLSDKDTPIDSIIIKLDLVVGNASSVAFTNDKSIVYVTLEDMENALNTHDDNADAHKPAFDAHNTDETAHYDMTGATSSKAGKRGFVPAPKAGDQNKALFGNGQFQDIPLPEIASQEEAEAGTDNTKIMTPLGVKQALNVFNTINKKLFVTPETTDKDGGQITLQKADNATIGINIDTYDDKFRIFGDEQVGNEFQYSPLTGDLKINGTLYNVKSIYTSSSNPTLIIGQPNDSSRIEIRDKSSSSLNPGSVLITAINNINKSIANFKADGTIAINTNDIGEKNVEIVESKGKNYIRYTNGLQICFNNTVFESTGSTITYAQPFSSNPVVIPVAYGTGSTTTKIDNNTTTGFIAYNTGNWNCGWIAIGYWK